MTKKCTSWVLKNCSFSSSLVENEDFSDFFDDNLLQSIKNRKEESRETVTETGTINLYRGFDYFTKDSSGNYVLSPEKSEQGLLWFTHDLQGPIVNPIEYAASRGKYFVTYPISVKKTFDIIKYNDGTQRRDIASNIETPDHTKNQTKALMNWTLYELPEGFIFSYKTEKFIGCSKELTISPDKIQLSKEIIEEED